MTNKHYTTKFGFVGDARQHQLSFPQYSVLQICQGQRPENGWLWGTCNGRKGWFPAWAVDFDEGNESQGIIGQSGIQSTMKMDDYNGFDLAVNEVMGGEIKKTARRPPVVESPCRGGGA
jgi:hypothetical protein